MSRAVNPNELDQMGSYIEKEGYRDEGRLARKAASELRTAYRDLHDRYTMAALSGLLMRGDYHSIEAVVNKAREVADSAMQARSAPL